MVTMDKELAHNEEQALRLSIALSCNSLLMQRENYRRRFPADTDAQLEARLREWVVERPGDGPGQEIQWNR